MSKIVRTPTRAEGGITPEEKAQMDKITAKWIKNAFRTEPINKDKITKAIKDLYKVSDLKEPRVVIVPSPFVMALSYGLASGIWQLRGTNKLVNNATRGATDWATRDATMVATDVATRGATVDATHEATHRATAKLVNDATVDAIHGATDVVIHGDAYTATNKLVEDATRGATMDATRGATRDATMVATRGATVDATYTATHRATMDATNKLVNNATRGATDVATRGAMWLHDLALHFGGNEEDAKVLIGNISKWNNAYQGGNMWSYFGAYAEAMRDVIGLTGLDCWDKYRPWEDAMKEGGFRVMHEKFCIVSDFPKTLLVDEQNRPHCDSGPSHEWRDGFKIYHLHGVRFDEEMHKKLTSGDFTLEELATNTNMTADQRAEALFWLPPEKLLKQVKAELIHTGIKGTKLYHVPEILDAKDQYCMLMEHPTIKGRFFIEWVDPEVGKLKDADLAQCYAWQDEDGDPIPLEDYLLAIEA